MENLLTKLASQSDVKSVTGLADSIHVAKEAVKIPAVPVHERRAKCFTVFHQVLTANKPKLSLLALEGLSLMLRDAALLNDSTTKKPEDALSVQMLKSLEDLPTLDKQIQCQIITVIVQLISSNEVNVSLNDVYEALQICTKTFATTEDVSVKLAVRAAITQMLNSFCSNRHAKVFQHATPSQEEIAVLMDMTALLTEVYRRLSTAETIDDLQLGLDSVYSVLSAQPESFHKHAPLLNVFSTELVPCLLCLLHATDDKPPPTKSLLSISPSMPLKFNIFSLAESARSFYQVVEQVLRLLARVPDAEPLALELFRNSLLSPHVSRRSEALRLLKRLFSTQSRFIEYLDLCAREPQFWPVVLFCLEDCSKVQGTEGVIDSIRVMNALFHGLFEQLQPAAIDKYTPVVHEILENAAKARQSGQKSSQRLKVTKRKNSDAEAERLAKEFVDRLGTELLEWLKLDEVHNIDEKIQEFAAKIAHEFTDLETDHNQTQSLLNTDAVYLTIFAALSFCLRLRENEEPDRLTFFGQVTGSGCIVYANENWLNAIYDILSQQDNLFNNTTDLEKSILIKVIEDYDGHNRKYLSTFIDEEEEDGNVGVVKKQLDARYTNFENWIRDQLQSSWSTVLSILSKYSLKLDKKESANKMQTDGVEATLESTTSLLRLLMTLRLPSEITWVFERIGEEVCLLEDLRQFIIKSAGSESKKPWRINRIDALCIGLLLDNCIECGTMAPTSWKHTVRTIEYVTELEKYLFRLTKTANIQYDASEVSLADLLGKIVPNELSLATVGRVLDELMLKIDNFFEDAPKILNLPSLCALLSVMCTADEDNLRNIEGVPIKVVAEVYVPACSLPRIARLVGGNVQRRLLVHRLRIWGTVKDHFVETMSSKFPFDIAKLSINSVHECMRALLGVEPDGSCFHQSLFTAYQNVLCCEVCSAETQEQIVASLATFIEDSPQRIGSGWKPLFGALKAIRISPAKQKTEDAADTQKSALTPANHAVIGVFRRYIEIGDPQILIPTALEFIHCIVHYLQSTEGFEQAFPNHDAQPSSEHERDTQFGQTAFSFIPELKRQLLLCFDNAANGDLSQIPAPASLLNRLRHREQSMEMVDEGLVDEKLEDVSDLSTCLFEDTTFEVQPSRLNEKVTITQKQFPWTDWTDGQKCVVELLLSSIDELAGLTLTCSRQILSQLLTGLATFIGSLRDSHLGLPFGIHCLCSNILPLIQKWSRREHRGFVSSAQIPQSLRNLKQTTTVFAELAVDYVRNDPQNEWNEHLVAQILVLFNDLISHQSPFIAGTGSACLRHFISSLADELSIQSLSSVTSSLWKATCLTMAPIRKLIAKFVVNSVDLNGDIGEVHVIVKEDAQTVDYSELRAMAFQIFQIEQQTHRFRQTSVDEDGDEKKRPQFAYVFVFRPKTTNASTTQPPERAVTMDEIVAGLMSAQSLLQLFSFILLGTLHSATFCGESTDPQQLNRSASVSTTHEMETSIGRRLTRLQMGKVFACLDAVNFVANEFDQRPSLKYLLQKLINGDQVSNLYKLEVASQAIKLQTVYELAKQLSPTKDDVIKVTKSQGAANSNLAFLRLIDTLVDQSFSSLEDLEGQAIKSPSAAGNLRDRMDLECGQLRLSEDFETTQGAQPATPKTPTARTNPFLNRIQSLRSSSGARASTDSSDGLQVAQLSDLDLRLIAQSEIVAILIERVVREEPAIFRVFLPLFLPKIRKLMRICPAKRARFACSEFLNRLDHELEISTT